MFTGSLGALNRVRFGQMVFVDATSGSDTTGTRGRMDRPFKTISAALLITQSGDTVYIGAGTYAETITIPNRTLSLTFEPSVNITPAAGNDGLLISGFGAARILKIEGKPNITVTGAGRGVRYFNTTGSVYLSLGRVISDTGNAINIENSSTACGIEVDYILTSGTNAIFESGNLFTFFNITAHQIHATGGSGVILSSTLGVGVSMEVDEIISTAGNSISITGSGAKTHKININALASGATNAVSYSADVRATITGNLDGGFTSSGASAGNGGFINFSGVLRLQGFDVVHSGGVLTIINGTIINGGIQSTGTGKTKINGDIIANTAIARIFRVVGGGILDFYGNVDTTGVTSGGIASPGTITSGTLNFTGRWDSTSVGSAQLIEIGGAAANLRVRGTLRNNRGGVNSNVIGITGAIAPNNIILEESVLYAAGVGAGAGSINAPININTRIYTGYTNAATKGAGVITNLVNAITVNANVL